MSRKPPLDAIEFWLPDRAEPRPDNLSYWSRRDRWEELGRKIAALRDAAKLAGRPLESMPGAPVMIAAFRALGRELDRRAR